MYLPPVLTMILTWSTVFRSEGTFANYLGYVKTACMIKGASVSVFNEPAITRCKVATKKRCISDQRPKMWIQLNMLEKIVSWSIQQVEEVVKKYALLFVTTYVFLLRLPSEALPIRAGNVGGAACMYLENNEVVLTLAKRCVMVVFDV